MNLGSNGSLRTSSSCPQRAICLFREWPKMFETKPCKICKLPIKKNSKRKVYCSQSCAQIGQKQSKQHWYRERNPNIPKICEHCKTQIPSSLNRKTSCSTECAFQISHLKRKQRNFLNREDLNKKKNEWRINNLEKSRESVRRSMRKRRSTEGAVKREVARYRSLRKKSKVFLFTSRDDKRLLARQNNRCAYCDCLLTAKTKNLDHVLPVSRGGSYGIANLVYACQSCNSSKSNKFLIEWRYARTRKIKLNNLYEPNKP
jgi:hypothetical protein